MVSMEPMTEICPPVFYFGTPVALITTRNADGTSNISPISSAWALGDRYLLGLGTGGHAMTNLRRLPELVNLPSADQAPAVEAIAPTTGSWPVPPHKQPRYSHVADKVVTRWFHAGRVSRGSPATHRRVPRADRLPELRHS
jgi:flavin reductase (DIM6/NTAB) family NADH-FMN oxidoreductase RutF